jgi:hypothetical protein
VYHTCRTLRKQLLLLLLPSSWPPLPLLLELTAWEM